MRGWRLFTISGIDIEINYSWLFIFILLVMALSMDMRQAAPDAASWQPLFAGTLAALLLFASVLFHELAHSFTARRFGIGIARITLFIFGGLAQTKGDAQTGRSEMLIAAIGPLSSLALAAVLLGLGAGLALLPLGPLPAAVVHRVGIINIYLAVFNLLPAFPLDGGRLLRGSLWELWGDLRRSTRLATTLGRLFGYVLIAIGVYYTFTSGFINGLWFFGLGYLLTQAATQSWQSLRVREALSAISVGHAVRPIPAVLTPDASLEQAIQQFLAPYRLELMPVAEDGVLIGILETSTLSRYSRPSWPHLTVRQAMTPWDPEKMLLPASMDLGAAVDKMSAEERREVLVVDDQGQLLGILTQHDIIAAAQRLGPMAL